MTIAALLAALVAVNIAYLLLLDRRDTRDRTERDADRAERQTLLQRIQAPQVAVVDHSQGLMTDDPTSLPFSDEELAERQAREAAVAFIEQFERPEGDR